jgi:PHD/YefM family antitoxin component YafN of YafNO toxin-antitoxin module
MSADTLPELQYVTDASGKAISVIIPIDVWQEIVSERETAYLLNSPAMHQRLLEAKERSGGISFEDARAKLNL